MTQLENYLAACPTSGPLMLGATGFALIVAVLNAAVRALDARDARLRYEADKPLLDARLRDALDALDRQGQFDEACRRG